MRETKGYGSNSQVIQQCSVFVMWWLWLRENNGSISRNFGNTTIIRRRTKTKRFRIWLWVEGWFDSFYFITWFLSRVWLTMTSKWRHSWHWRKLSNFPSAHPQCLLLPPTIMPDWVAWVFCWQFKFKWFQLCWICHIGSTHGSCNLVTEGSHAVKRGTGFGVASKSRIFMEHLFYCEWNSGM